MKILSAVATLVLAQPGSADSSLSLCEQKFYQRALEEALKAIHKIEDTRTGESKDPIQPGLKSKYLSESEALKTFEENYAIFHEDLRRCED